VRPGWDVVWLSDIPWASLWQRPQQLATRFPEGTRILFVEPWTLGAAPAIRPAPVARGVVRVTFPFLPLHARSQRLRRLAYRLGSSGIATAALVQAQRARARALRGFFREGAPRLALVQNFMGFPFLGSWKPDRVVYDMIDAPLHFAPVPPRLVPHWEALLRSADRVVVTSGPLYALAVKGGSRAVTLIGNGVEASRFTADRVTPAVLPGRAGAPAFGYVGSLHAWVDVPLLIALARAIPEAKVVLVGPAPPSTAGELTRAAAEIPNFFWLGSRPYEEVPSLVRAFRVGLIPFRRTPLTEAVNPVKLYEYAAAGVPCLTTRFSDEVDRWAEAARVALDDAQFVAMARALLSEAPDRGRLAAFAAGHDWNEIAREFVGTCLEDAA
jgi:glycosyltransferase involved in cell wall biosynthesis